MKLILGISLSLLSHALTAQAINVKLKKELDSMYVLDQKYRKLMFVDTEKSGDSLAAAFGVTRNNLYATLWKFQNQVDASNVIRIEAILNTYGYPGKKLVGEPTNEATFYVLQHSKLIDKYIPLVKLAAEQKDLPFRLYAMMQDRWLVEQQKEQIYGTQGHSYQVKNEKSGDMETISFIWPIQDPEHVNERRKAAGFKLSVEDNAKRLDIVYKVYTLEEIKKLKGF